MPRLSTTTVRPPASPATDVRRRGAAGKALIVWLVSGSGIAAIIAYLLFSSMGC